MTVFSEADSTKAVRTMSFKQLGFKISDDFSLFAKIHQRGTMWVVEVKASNTPEAKHMIIVVNKHSSVIWLPRPCVQPYAMKWTIVSGTQRRKSSPPQ